MTASFYAQPLRSLIAIYMIASCAVSMPASAQNTLQNRSEISITIKQLEQAERDRIKSERTAATQALNQQRQACYQKLAVTPCLNDARDAHNDAMRDLKRQETAQNDVQRKRAAADRVGALDQRNSTEAQLKRAQERGKALEATARRELSQEQRKKSWEAKQASAASVSNMPATPKQSNAKQLKSAPQPKGKPPQQRVAKQAPVQRPGQAAKMEKSRQQAIDREKAAALRRAEALQREAKRKKPAAAGLPIPG